MMTDRVSEERRAWTTNDKRDAGSMPALRPKNVQHFKAKVFKSGNSLALRLPAGIGLVAGQEMTLRTEDGIYFSFEPLDAPKRKFAIDKVWGSAAGLELIDRQNRWFSERRLVGDPQPDGDDDAA